MTEFQRALLVEILTETDRLDEITVSLDSVSRSVTVRYEDLDDEWFREMAALDAQPPMTIAEIFEERERAYGKADRKAAERLNARIDQPTVPRP